MRLRGMSGRSVLPAAKCRPIGPGYDHHTYLPTEATMFRLRRIRALSAAALLFGATILGAGQAAAEPLGPAGPPPVPRPVIGAYYAGWNSATYPVAQIPADRITHLFYAF